MVAELIDLLKVCVFALYPEQYDDYALSGVRYSPRSACVHALNMVFCSSEFGLMGKHTSR